MGKFLYKVIASVWIAWSVNITLVLDISHRPFLSPVETVRQRSVEYRADRVTLAPFHWSQWDWPTFSFGLGRKPFIAFLAIWSASVYAFALMPCGLTVEMLTLCSIEVLLSNPADSWATKNRPVLRVSTGSHHSLLRWDSQSVRKHQLFLSDW